MDSMNKEQIQKWEYITLYIRRETPTIPRLNELGAQGWEVCGMDIDRSSCGGEYGISFILKRPITNSKPPTTEELT